MPERLPLTWGLLTLVADAVYHSVSYLVQDRGEPVAGPAPDALSDVRFCEGRFAGLHAVGLLRWQPAPQNSPPWQRFLLVEFAQYCPPEELERARQDLEAGRSSRYWDLTKPAKRVQVEIGVGENPDPLPREWQRALRNLAKRRFNPKKISPPPDGGAEALTREAHRFLQQDDGEPIPEWVFAVLFPEPPAHHDALQPGGWRRFHIEPDHQTEDDICFLLALVLLQEGMVPEAEVEPMKNVMVNYLHEAIHLDLSGAIS